MKKLTLIVSIALMLCSSAFAADCLTTTTISAGGTYTVTGTSPINATADCFKISGLTDRYHATGTSWAEIDCQGKTFNMGTHKFATTTGGTASTGDLYMHNCILNNNSGSTTVDLNGLHVFEDQNNTYNGPLSVANLTLYQFSMTMYDGYVNMNACPYSVIIGASIDDSGTPSLAWNAGYLLVHSDSVYFQNITVTAALLDQTAGPTFSYSNIDDGIASLGVTSGTPTQGPYVDNLTTNYVFDYALETVNLSSGVFLLNSHSNYSAAGLFGCFHNTGGDIGCQLDNSWFYNNDATSGYSGARLFDITNGSASSTGLTFTNNVFLNNILHKGANNLAVYSVFGNDGSRPFSTFGGNIFGGNDFTGGGSTGGFNSVYFQTLNSAYVRDFGGNKCASATPASGTSGFITCH